MSKRVVSSLLILCLIFTILPTMAFATKSGTCGNNLTWTLDNNGVLTISGEGAMDIYSFSSDQPWYSYQDNIIAIVIHDGVTSIGNHAFFCCYDLTSISIPRTVTSISEKAFYSCDQLTDIYYDGSEEEWEEIEIDQNNWNMIFDRYDDITIHYNDAANADSDASSLTGWRKAYYDYIRQDRSNRTSFDQHDWEFTNYQLIYLDGDNIPELWIDYVDYASGCYIVTYYEGVAKPSIVSGWSKLTYEEYNNIFNHSYGHHGIGGDTIYALEKGSLVKKASGSWDINHPEKIEYMWNDEVVSKNEYLANIDSYVDPDNSIDTYSDQIPKYTYNEILEFLASGAEVPSVTDGPKDDTDIDFNHTARQEWIDQHIEYAGSEEYKDEIIPGYDERMLAVFRDALEDEDIKGYDIAKATAQLLDLNLDFSESDVYEILLAEIMYSRPNLEELENSYILNLTDATEDTLKLLFDIVKNVAEAKDLPKKVWKNIESSYELLMTIDINSPDFNEPYSKFLSMIEKNFDMTELKKGFGDLKKDAISSVIDLAIKNAFEIYDSLVDIINYINNYVAYQNTSDQFQAILDQLLNYIYITMGNHGLDGAGDFSELINADAVLDTGLLNAWVNWTDLAAAIISFINTANQYEQEITAAVAEYAVTKTNETVQNMKENTERTILVFGLDFLCSKVPGLNAIPIVKGALNIGILLADLTTNVDDCKYALTMLIKLYCISVMMDEVVDNCASRMNADDKNIFFNVNAFDEAVDIYQNTQLLAAEYAIIYTDLVLENAKSDLDSYDEDGIDWFKKREKLEQEVAWYTNSLNLLTEQYEELHTIECHDSDIRYEPNTDEVIYNFKDSRIYFVACPVNVTITNSQGEQIAYLSNNNCDVAKGHEIYYRTIRRINNPAETIKVAVVPNDYHISLNGTDIGTMDVFVSEFSEDAEVVSYLKIPVGKDSSGTFEINPENQDEMHLVMDGIIYYEADDSETVSRSSSKKVNSSWVWIAVGILTVTVIATVVLVTCKQKKHHQ